MEENSEAHMDSAVSSTSEGTTETQEATSSHHNMETVIVVEQIKDEEASPSKLRKIEEKKADSQSEKNTSKSAEQGSLKEPPIKKIIIKASNKDYQIVKIPIVQKSPNKKDETHKLAQKESQAVLDSDSSASITSTGKSATNSETVITKSPVKVDEKISTKSPEKDSTLKIMMKSPTKESESHQSKIESPAKASAVKNPPIKIIIAKEMPPKVISVQEQSVKVTPPKEQAPSASSTMIETEKLTTSPAKEPESKSTSTPDVQQSEQDQPDKLEKPNKQDQGKTNLKEKVSEKISPIKDHHLAENLKDCSSTANLKDLAPKTAPKTQSEIKKTMTDSSDDKKTEATITSTVLSLDIDREASNDSQANSDISEKEHNRSISRELRSLINSAKESKIISECTQLTSKTRKSRGAALDNSNTSLNASVEGDKIHIRRGSTNSQISGSSEKSEKVLKRSMRSQNPEFAHKVKQFLNSVTGKMQKGDEDMSDEEIDESKTKEKQGTVEPVASTPKKKKIDESVPDQPNKLRTDPYCWRCHWAIEMSTTDKSHPPIQCTVCPRSFHFKCLTLGERSKINMEKNCVCPECLMILHAESSDTRSPAMKKISLGMLCELLKHALERMMEVNGVEPFMQPVDRTAFPDYDKCVVHPMDLSKMKQQILDGQYGSTEAFIADAQWILHNSIIFNSLQSKLTVGARSLVRSCRAEMGEIEACPECYAAAHARRSTWFTDVCSTPHILLWAKLKGFPYWPAKGMTVNSSGLVDVRFFGAHDRAWVPAKDCFLYSEKDPNNFRTKRQDILDSMQEAEQHIRNISRKYGKFVYPPFKTQFDPSKLYEQIKMMIPMFEGEVRAPTKEKPPSSSPNLGKEKSRSASKSSKGSIQECDMSDVDDRSESRKLDETMDIDKEEKKDGGENESSDKDKDKTEKPKDISDIPEDKSDSSIDKNDKPKEKIEKEEDGQKNKEIPMEVDVTLVKDTKETKESKGIQGKDVKEIEPSRKRRRSELVEAVITICDTSSSREKRKRGNSDVKAEQSKKDVKEPPNTSKESVQTMKDIEKSKRDVTPKRKVTESPAIGNVEKNPTPKGAVKIISVTRVVKHVADTGKVSPKVVAKPKDKAEATSSIELVTSTPEDKLKVQKRRSSNKGNKSLNNSNTAKTDKEAEKKNDKSADSKEKQIEISKSKSTELNKPGKSNETTSSVASIEKSTAITKTTNATTKSTTSTTKTTTNSAKTSSPGKCRSNFDDDTCLAVIARETVKSNPPMSSNATGLPTITSVRSLNPESASKIPNANTLKSIEVTIEASSNSSIFTPTSTENVRNMKEAVDKLQKLRNESETQPNPHVGKVGVRAFARMKSPSVEEARNNQKNQQTNVQVEIKTEPIDLDEVDRHTEKMDLMNACKLRPVNGPANLREVRINKVVVSSASNLSVNSGNNTSNNTGNNTGNNNKKAAPKQAEVRPRAKKSFPQPKKPDDGRSELNSKNSMVYIPIQPPMTQAPVRPARPVNANGPVTATTPPRPTVPVTTGALIHAVNTVTTSLVSGAITSLSSPTATPTTTSTINASSPIQAVPTVGQVPTTVHTVPLITSVNGQWTFSLQPVMSVGGVDNAPVSPMLNGVVAERGNNSNQLNPAVNAPGPVPAILPTGPPTLLPATPPNLVPTVPQQPATRPGDSSAPGELPRLMQRPNLMNPLDANTPVGSVPPPSTAGPLTAKLNQNAVKMADFFRTLLEDSIEKLDEPVAQVTALKLQLEQTNWKHQQQIDELKHNQELTLAEMRSSFEKEKVRIVSETRRAAQVELEAAVKQAKSKQWCANCSQEAQFYCCWNTSYCDYPCQRAHWTQHFAVCTQKRPQDGNADEDSSENRLQQPPENLPKTTAAPNLTVGGKLAPSRVYTQQDNTNKSSIIMSMVEDSSGNQSLKCVGTYKPPSNAQMSPLILNKQLMSNEEAAKKVVTSGGYLIVGASNSTGSNSAAIVTQSRRTHTIQYYS